MIGGVPLPIDSIRGLCPSVGSDEKSGLIWGDQGILYKGRGIRARNDRTIAWQQMSSLLAGEPLDTIESSSLISGPGRPG